MNKEDNTKIRKGKERKGVKEERDGKRKARQIRKDRRGCEKFLNGKKMTCR